jgi:hypothetical protein
MGQIEGGIRAQGGNQAHSGANVKQPDAAMKVPTGNAGAGNIKVKNPNKTASPNPTAPKAPSGQQGQERAGHKYLKREWDHKASKWNYIYTEPSGNKYHSHDKLHEESVKPKIEDDLSHVRLAKHHHGNQIKTLKDLHAKTQDLNKKQGILNEIKQHQEGSREMEDKELDLLSDPKYADQKFENAKDTPSFKRATLSALDGIANAIIKRFGSSTYPDRLEKMGFKKVENTKEFVTEYLDTLAWEEKHRPKAKMSAKVAAAERQAKERYKSLQREEVLQKEWTQKIEVETDKKELSNKKEHIENIKNNLSKSETEKDGNFVGDLTKLKTNLNKTLVLEDVKGSLVEAKETARNLTFYIRAHEKTKPSTLEKHLNDIKRQIATALKVPKEYVQFVKNEQDLNVLGVSIPKEKHKYVIGMKPYINSVLQEYSKNPVKNPFFLGFNIDSNGKELGRELNTVSLDGTTSHVFCGGTTGAGKSNAILCDIFTQKALGRDVKSVIIDYSSVHVYKDLANNVSDVHFAETIDDMKHSLKAIASEIKKRNMTPRNEIPKDGFPEIRLYIDEMNKLFESLNKMKRSKEEKNELSPEEIIRGIARDGRKANVHIITFGQSTRLEDVPADLRDNSLKVGLYSNGKKLPGMPDGQQFVTPKGHNISVVNGEIKESLLPRVHDDDFNLILSNNILNRESGDEKNNEDAKEAVSSESVLSDESIIKDPGNLAMIVANSQVDMIKNGETSKEKVVAENPVDGWLNGAIEKQGVKNFDKNNLVVSFKKKVDDIKKGKQLPDKATLEIMKNVSKHPDPNFSAPAKEAKEAIENELKTAPHLKELDAAPGLATFSGKETPVKRGRKAGSKNKQNDQKEQNKTDNEALNTGNKVEETGPYSAISKNLENKHNDLYDYVKKNKNKDVASAIGHLKDKFDSEFNYNDVKTELNKNEKYKNMDKAGKNKILESVDDVAFKNYLNRNLKALKSSDAKNNLSNAINNDFPSDHEIHSFDDESARKSIDDLLNGDLKNTQNAPEKTKAAKEIKPAMIQNAAKAAKKEQTWQDILNEPENFDNEDVVSMEDINDEGQVKAGGTGEAQSTKESGLISDKKKENAIEKPKAEKIKPQDYRGLTIEPSENGISVRHPEDDYSLADFDNLADAKKYSDHLANKSDVSNKKQFDKDWYNLHSDAMSQIKKNK